MTTKYGTLGSGRGGRSAGIWRSLRPRRLPRTNHQAKTAHPISATTEIDSQPCCRTAAFRSAGGRLSRRSHGASARLSSLPSRKHDPHRDPSRLHPCSGATGRHLMTALPELRYRSLNPRLLEPHTAVVCLPSADMALPTRAARLFVSRATCYFFLCPPSHRRPSNRLENHLLTITPPSASTFKTP
jgi:hypothetical protein